MKVLVTGGVGFIGSNFIRIALKNKPEWKITNYDKLTYCGNLDNLKDVENNPNYSFIQGDICDEKKVAEAMKDIDLVINFAAESHVDNSIKTPFIFTRVNVLGTHVLLEVARQAGVKRFLHISTDEVYGSVEEGKSVESDLFKPNSPYSASKAAAEHLVRAYYKTYGFPTLIARSSNNFGPYQYPEKLIPLFVNNLTNGKKVPVYGKGNNMRDWIFVEDNCEGLLTVAEKGKIGEAYNIGGGNVLTNMDITRQLLEILGKDDSYIEFVEDRLGHDFRYCLDSGKTERLGWKPKHDFKEALKKTVRWYTENKEWIENIERCRK